MMQDSIEIIFSTNKLVAEDRTPPHVPVPDAITATEPVRWTWEDRRRQLQACKMQGLLEGDQHWYDTLNEAIQTRAPFQLRLLLATICGFGEVNDIPELWFRYKDAVSEDFVRQYSEDSGPQYATCRN
ncbi:hypothetical protein AVEN_271285-1 [Araneus ventricosus]|uniref:Uncharacterized protein n=1 Tax=Araneus ventricosus TaxID=182803 RepID=A0A4Y2JNX2_ARAVE|nr:hypothetical protein AVEN_271285-1 [Araneus ventricosus]